MICIPAGTILSYPKDDTFALKLKLGTEVLESVPEEYRGRVIGFGSARDGEEWLGGNFRQVYAGPTCSGDWPSPRIILTAEPAPAPKTDKELLADLVQKYDAHQHSENPDTAEDIAFDQSLAQARGRVNG